MAFARTSAEEREAQLVNRKQYLQRKLEVERVQKEAFIVEYEKRIGKLTRDMEEVEEQLQQLHNQREEQEIEAGRAEGQGAAMPQGGYSSDVDTDEVEGDFNAIQRGNDQVLGLGAYAGPPPGFDGPRPDAPPGFEHMAAASCQPNGFQSGYLEEIVEEGPGSATQGDYEDADEADNHSTGGWRTATSDEEASAQPHVLQEPADGRLRASPPFIPRAVAVQAVAPRNGRAMEPIEGQDLRALLNRNRAKDANHSGKMVEVTKKGRGFAEAPSDPDKYHTRPLYSDQPSEAPPGQRRRVPTPAGPSGSGWDAPGPRPWGRPDDASGRGGRGDRGYVGDARQPRMGSGNEDWRLDRVQENEWEEPRQRYPDADMPPRSRQLRSDSDTIPSAPTPSNGVRLGGRPANGSVYATQADDFPSLGGASNGRARPAGAWGQGSSPLLQAAAVPAPHAAAGPSAVPSGAAVEEEEVRGGLREPHDAASDAQRRAQMRSRRNIEFVESIRGRPVNIGEGLELHEEVVSAGEQRQLVQCVEAWVEQGHRGELRGRTFSAPRKWLPGKGRKTIQFGCCYNYAIDALGREPGIIPEEVVEPLPMVLQALCRRLTRWRVLSQEPNTAIVNVYEAGDCIPPHIDNHDFDRPFCTLSLLSQERILFAKKIESLGPGEFHAPFSLPLPAGSCLVLKGAGADVAQHCIPPVSARRISITLRRMHPHFTVRVLAEYEAAALRSRGAHLPHPDHDDPAAARPRSSAIELSEGLPFGSWGQRGKRVIKPQLS